MSVIKYDIVTTNDSVEVNLYKTGSTDILISAHTITNTFGVENTFSYSDEIFENGIYKIITIDSISATTIHNNIDVTCFAPQAWKFTIQTDASGTTNTSQFTLPTVSGYNYDAIIDWGDSNQTPLTGHTDTNKTHVYSAPGTYQITITGLFEALSFNYHVDSKKLISLDTPIGVEQNLSYIHNGFTSCSNLTAICDDIFRYSTAITDFSGTFVSCTSLTALPVNIFRYNNFVTNFDYTFHTCTSLTTLPVDIFKYNTVVTSFINTFRNCTSLTTLDVDIFRYNIAVTDFSQTFYYCSSLTALPVNIFKYNTVVTNFSITFFNCTSLTTLPVDIFKYNTAVTYFSGTFLNCTSLTTLPVDIFKYNTGVISFSQTFHSCTSLTALPTDLFRYNTDVTTFSRTFHSCTSLTTLPENLFYYNNLVTIYDYTFVYCELVLPTTIFNLNNLNIVTNFSEFLKVDNSSTSSTGNIQDIWNYAIGATHVDSFTNQTSLTNYSSIPNNWKGL